MWTSNYAGISFVNGMLNALVFYVGGYPDFSRVFVGIDYWMWDDEDEGFRIAGVSFNLWDILFVIQVIVDGLFVG